jgi:phospholipase C
LPYELHAEGRLSEDRRRIDLTLSARNERFGKLAAGAPFYVYAPSGYRHNGKTNRTRYYAVAAGKSLRDHWLLSGFPDGRYHLCVCGPNGFLLELRGDSEDPEIQIHSDPAQNSRAELALTFANMHRQQPYSVAISHHAYGTKDQKRTLLPGQTASIRLDLTQSFLWYDFSLQVEGFELFKRRYAGHMENGQPSFSDPAMGRVAG